MQDQDSHTKDLIIVGAGIHSLTILLRYLDEEADLIEEVDRSEFYMNETKISQTFGSWKNCRNRINRWTRSGVKDTTLLSKLKKVLVIDTHGEWLHEWKTNFSAFEIPHLRSAIDLHPSPRDPRDLYAFAANQRRNSELTVMDHTHGKIIDGFRGPYMIPSTKLFNDFCDMLINAFNVSSIIQKGTVQGISKINPETYQLTTVHGTMYKSKKVVLCLGPKVSTTKLFWEPEEESYPPSRLWPYHRIAKELNQKNHIRLPMMLKNPHVLIVGGGITSAHLVKVAVNSGYKVTLLMRSTTCIREFDIAKVWMGKHRGDLLHEFRKISTVDERISVCAKERSGGSFSPEVWRSIQKLVKMGDVELQEETEIASLYWNKAIEKWNVRLDTGEMCKPDCIWISTGLDVHVSEYPLVQNLLKQDPISCYSGFPSVREDLSWSNNFSSLFVMGCLATSRLGPDALNISGSRHAAILLANQLKN